MEHAPDLINDIKRQYGTSAALEPFLTELRTNFPPGPDGVPQIPGMSPERTQAWLARVARADGVIQDAGNRSALLEDRKLAQSAAARTTEDLETLKHLPAEMKALAAPRDGRPAPTEAQLELQAIQKTNAHEDVEKRFDQYDRAIAAPTDTARTESALKALSDFRSGAVKLEPPVTFGMSQIMSAQEQKNFVELEKRFDAVNRVNKYLNYGQTVQDFGNERDKMENACGAVLKTTPRELDDFYSSSMYLVRGDGFEQKQKVNTYATAIDRELTKIQQRDGIGPDGTFKLPGLSEEQSKAWVDRCERIGSALEDANKRGGPAKLTRDARSSMDQAKADLTTMTAIPQQLQALQNSNLSPDQRRAETDRLLAQYDRIDKNTQQFELEAPRKRGFADRMSDAWDKVKDSFRSSTSSQSVATPAQTPVRETMAQQLPAQAKQNDVAGQTIAQTVPAHTAPAPTVGGQHITVSSGEIGHELSKGAGFTAMGKVDAVKHEGSTVEIDYTVRGQHFDVKIDEKDEASRALGEAAEHLKPGEAFKMSIGRDRDGKEVAEIDDRTTGHSVRVDRAGHVEEKNVTPELSRSRENVGR